VKRLRFVKMEGAGNDYVYVDGVHQPLTVDAAARLAAPLADRHFGVGGDGLILLAPSAVADVRMVMWNGDGSRGSMCGNGVRCAAKLAHDEGIAARRGVTVETDAGVREVELLFAAGQVVGARVAMGEVAVELQPRTVMVAGREWQFLVGSAGNPHAVTFVSEDLDRVPVAAVGGALQREPTFAAGVNVEFVRVLDQASLQQRTFERGAGETLACGSGATFAAVSAVRSGRVRGPRVLVRLRGGDLVIELGEGGVTMEGPAREVFRGEIDLARFAP
jgi:diaminopimelate epimerase